MNKRIVIFVSSPNSYSDVFYSFLKCFYSFCKNVNCEIVLSTNNQRIDGIKVYNNFLENDTWMERTIPVLKVLETKYILLICDDCIIQKEFDFSIIDRILDEMDHHGIMFCGLANGFKGKRTEKN